MSQDNSARPSSSPPGNQKSILRQSQTDVSTSGYQSFVMARRNSGRTSTGSIHHLAAVPTSLATPPSSLPNPPGNSPPSKPGPSFDPNQREPPPPMNAGGAVGASLRMLCVNGQTYTLTPQVEEIFKCVTRIGTLLTRYKRSIETKSNRDSETGQSSSWNVFSMFDSDEEAGPVSPRDKHKGKFRARSDRGSVGDSDSSKVLSEGFEEAKRLLLTLESMLQPLKTSSGKLDNAMKNLPLLSDFEFWGGEYDSRISKIVEWDDASRQTILDQIIPQHVVVYHAIRPLLIKELPTTSSMSTVIQNPTIRAEWIDILGKIHDIALEVRVVSNEALSSTKTLTGGLQNCLLSLQYSVRKDFVSAPDRDVQDENPSQASLIVDSLTRLVESLRQLRMPDGLHVDASPTSYLDIDPDSGTCLISKLLRDIATETHFLQQHRPLHNHFPAKYLLPYFFEIASYTRGSALTQIDRLLAGFVLQQEMILAAKWEMLGISSVEQEIKQVANSGNPPQGLSTVAEEGPEGDYRTLKEHKFSFKLIPLPKVSPELRNGPAAAASPLTSPTLMRHGRGVDMSNPLASPPIGYGHFDMSNPLSGPSGGLHLAGSPPQKIWPVSSFAVTSRGVLSKSMGGELSYSIGSMLGDAHEKATTESNKSFLDENFSLDEVLKFYAVTLGPGGLGLQIGVIGSQVATRLLRSGSESSVEGVPQNPVAAKTSREGDTHRNSSHIRRKNQLFDMLKRLKRFDFDSPIKSTTSESTPAIPMEPLPQHNTTAVLTPEVTKTLKACFAVREEYRSLLRILSEMKTEVRCAFEGANALQTYAEAGVRKEAFAPVNFRDRECNWRKVSKVNVDQLHGH